MDASLQSKTLVPLRIVEILRRYSDANHVLTQQDIINKLKCDYGIEVERKTISRHITNLSSAGLEIEDTRRGYYITQAQFEDVEAQWLIDSVLFSRYIPAKYAKELIVKIAELATPTLRERVLSTVLTQTIEREDNKELPWTVEQVNVGISTQRKITFLYGIYDCDKQLHPVWSEPITVSPLFVTAARGNYYLIGIIDGSSAPTNFRLDKITQIELTKKKITPSVKNYVDKGMLDEYLRSRPFMYCGVSQKITLKADKIIFDDIVDYFGKDFTVVDQDEYSATIVLNANEYDIVEWAMQHAAFAEILSPQHVRDGMIKNAQILAEKYPRKGSLHDGV